MNMAAKQAIWVILGGSCRGRWGWLWGWTGLFVAQSFRCVVQHSIRRLAPSLRIRKGGTSGMSRFARHDCFFFTDGVMIHFRFTRHCSTCHSTFGNDSPVVALILVRFAVYIKMRSFGMLHFLQACSGTCYDTFVAVKFELLEDTFGFITRRRGFENSWAICMLE